MEDDIYDTLLDLIGSYSPDTDSLEDSGTKSTSDGTRFEEHDFEDEPPIRLLTDEELAGEACGYETYANKMSKPVGTLKSGDKNIIEIDHMEKEICGYESYANRMSKPIGTLKSGEENVITVDHMEKEVCAYESYAERMISSKV